MGNRTAKTDNVTGNEGYTFDNANRIATRQVGTSAATNYTSDANGNTLTDATHTNVWDSQNRLVSCQTSGNGANTSRFLYGADGLRRRMAVTNAGQSVAATITDYAYDSSNVVREFAKDPTSGVASISATYLMGPSGPMYRRPANAADVRWYVYDGLGSVVGEVDVNGILCCQKTTDVYGISRGNVGTALSRHGFVGGLGHYSDTETGLVYMRARYYDPAVGRFISEDPKLHGGNWFAYCCNNPVNGVDRSGYATLQETVGATAAAGGMGAAAGGGAIQAGQNMAEELGECVALEEVQISQWLDGGMQFRPNGDVVDVGEYVANRVAGGIEITATKGFESRMVFIDIVNKWGEASAEHIQGIHLDFQNEGWSAQDCWEQVALGMESFPGWEGK